VAVLHDNIDGTVCVQIVLASSHRKHLVVTLDRRDRIGGRRRRR
jgi:hypothetical protein